LTDKFDLYVCGKSMCGFVSNIKCNNLHFEQQNFEKLLIR